MSGLSAVVGYGVGSAISALVRQFVRAEPRPDYKRIAWIALAVAAVFGSILLMWLSHRWQNELRALIGIDDEPGFSGLGSTDELVFANVRILLRSCALITLLVLATENRAEVNAPPANGVLYDPLVQRLAVLSSPRDG